MHVLKNMNIYPVNSECEYKEKKINTEKSGIQPISISAPNKWLGSVRNPPDKENPVSHERVKNKLQWCQGVT